MAKDYISASQYGAFVLCQRKWFLRQGLESSTTNAQQIGKDFHTVVELLLKGQPVPSSFNPQLIALAQEGLTKYPIDQKDILHTEQEVRGVLIETQTDGLQLRHIDKLDLIKERGYPHCAYLGYVDLVYVDGLTLVISDHKTTSSWKWAKTEDALLQDAQLNLYASHYMTLMGLKDCIIEHRQYNTTACRDRTRLVFARTTLDAAKAVIAPLVDAYRTMQVLLTTDNWQAVPCNRSSCGAFGGCEFRHMCAFAQ